MATKGKIKEIMDEYDKLSGHSTLSEHAQKAMVLKVIEASLDRQIASLLIGERSTPVDYSLEILG